MSNKAFKCPECKAEVDFNNKSFPFCCVKCKGSDLYAWLNEERSIESEEDDRWQEE